MEKKEENFFFCLHHSERNGDEGKKTEETSGEWDKKAHTRRGEAWHGRKKYKRECIKTFLYP